MVVICETPCDPITHSQTQRFTCGVECESAQVACTRGAGAAGSADGAEAADGVIRLEHNMGGGICDGGDLAGEVVNVLDEIRVLVNADRKSTRLNSIHIP